MAKFSEVCAGPRARRAVKLPLPGAFIDPKTGEWEGPTADLEIRPLRDDEYLDVLARAAATAKSKGVEKPDESDPIYEHALAVHTIAIACVDKDSPKDAPVPFFDKGFDQIVSSEIMTPEVVAYLHLQQQLWQDEVSPLKKTFDNDPSQFLAAAIKTAGGDMSFFASMRPGLQWSFTRTLASLHVSSLANSSLSSASSEPPPSTSQ